MGSIEEAQWADRRFIMSKATLMFHLPEEQEQFEVAHRGQDLFFTVLDIDGWLRDQIKYGSGDELDIETLDAVRKELHAFMEMHDVNLEMMS